MQDCVREFAKLWVVGLVLMTNFWLVFLAGFWLVFGWFLAGFWLVLVIKTKPKK
jgi:hypothetical protein